MFVEYYSGEFHDGPLLLLGEVSCADAASLMEAFRPLAAAEGSWSSLSAVPGLRYGTRIGSLDAFSVDWDRGCNPVAGDRRAFQWALRPLTWDQVIGLLEPFTIAESGHCHQYLSDKGSVTLIASTDTSW